MEYAIARALDEGVSPSSTELSNWLSNGGYDWQVLKVQASFVGGLFDDCEKRALDRVDAAAKAAAEAAEAARFQRERWMDSAAAAGAEGW